MPLWMVLTKWPAPSGPTSAAQGSPLNFAEMSLKIVSTRAQASGLPPAMTDGPWRAPSSPPDTPTPRKSMPLAAIGLDPPLRVAEIGVAGIDQDVVLAEMRGEDVGLFVDRRAGLDHDHDRPRRPHGLGELGQRLAGRQSRREVAGVRR